MEETIKAYLAALANEIASVLGGGSPKGIAQPQSGGGPGTTPPTGPGGGSSV